MAHKTFTVPYFNLTPDTSLPSLQLHIATVLLILLPALYFLVTYERRRAKMPPYVRGWLIINQTLHHLSLDIPVKQGEWHRKYGPLF